MTNPRRVRPLSYRAMVRDAAYDVSPGICQECERDNNRVEVLSRGRWLPMCHDCAAECLAESAQRRAS